MSPDVVVVGGGIIGLGAALAARERGLEVTLLERDDRPVGASIRNFGHICLTPQSGIARTYGITARDKWLRYAQDASFWLRESGTLVVARHEDELAVLEQFAADRTDHTLGDLPEIEVFDADEAEARIPLARGIAEGGAHFRYDLQVNPREAAAALTRHAVARGVDVRTGVHVGRVHSGRVDTSGGALDTGLVVVATNHDIDRLLPEVAARHGIVRCGLDMMRVHAALRSPLDAPLLTGWSLLRYSGLASTPAAAAVRARLHARHPHLAALDLNQMYTQLPDGSLIVGDTHYRDRTLPPFQSEQAFEVLVEETAALFGVPHPTVIERWQGIYASASEPFLREEPEPGVLALAATTGIGMTTGLGLAEHAVRDALTTTPSTAREARS